MTKSSRRQTEVISLSLPKKLSKNLKRFAKERNSSVSQVTSDALKGYLFLSEWRKIQEAFAPAFKKLGIKTDDDVERYFG